MHIVSVIDSHLYPLHITHNGHATYSLVYQLSSLIFSHCLTLPCFSQVAFPRFVLYRNCLSFRVCFVASQYPKKSLPPCYMSMSLSTPFYMFSRSCRLHILVFAFSNWLLFSVSIYAICCLAIQSYALITYKYHKITIVSLVVRFSLPYNTCWFFASHTERLSSTRAFQKDGSLDN